MSDCRECGLRLDKQHHCTKWDCPKLRTLPTPERFQHGPIDPPAEVLTYDKKGRGSRSLAPRACDTLGRMLRRGSITVEMAKAGARFAADFRKAQLDPLKAADMARTGTVQWGNEGVGVNAICARARAWDALLAVGGLGSAGGSCIWQVVGWESTIKEWALEQGWNGRTVSEEAASGVLIAALGVLVAHYGVKIS